MSTQQPTYEALVRKSAAAAAGRCSERTIDRMIARGRLKSLRRDGRVYVLRESLDAWLSSTNP